MKHDYTDEEIKTAWKDSLSLREFLDALPERLQAAEIAKLKAERKKWEADALRYRKNADFWRSEHDKAQAVAAVVLAQAVRRMKAVPAEELWYAYEAANTGYGGMGAVRSRLIAAAKGEGQAPPVVVNEPPKDEGQPDLSGESEKQDPYARLKAYTKAGARIKCTRSFGASDWIAHNRWPWKYSPECYEVHPDDLHMCPEYAPQAEPPQPWTPTVGQTVRSIPEMALGGQMYWRDLAIQLAKVWWKCHNIGASLQHGDLDKDIAFSIVCERHGGRVFHGDTPENAWHKAEEWLLSPDRENFPAACLTPAKP